MKLKALWNICHANGIPPLLYKWSFTKDLEDGTLKDTLKEFFDDIDVFINKRTVLYLNLEDTALTRKIGATFFKVAILAGYMGSRYTTIEDISGYRRENWYEDGDVYDTLVHSDFLIIDKVFYKMEDWQRKIWNDFIEARILAERSTVLVGISPPNKVGVFSEETIDLLKDVNSYILTDTKLRNIKKYLSEHVAQ